MLFWTFSPLTSLAPGPPPGLLLLPPLKGSASALLPSFSNTFLRHMGHSEGPHSHLQPWPLCSGPAQSPNGHERRGSLGQMPRDPGGEGPVALTLYSDPAVHAVGRNIILTYLMIFPWPLSPCPAPQPFLNQERALEMAYSRLLLVKCLFILENLENTIKCKRKKHTLPPLSDNHY